MPEYQKDKNSRDTSYSVWRKKNDLERFSDLIDDSEFQEGQLDPSATDYFESEGRIKNDEELERVVKELLHNSRKIDARDITVTVNKSNVTLSGTVRAQEDRDYATSIVKLVSGVGDIKSDIIVKRNQGILPTDIGRNP